MRKSVSLPMLLLCALPITVTARDVEIQPSCNNATCQRAFDRVAADLVATIDYKALGPAEATGLTGIGVGVAMTWVPVEGADWQAVTGKDFGGLGLVGVQVTKGLPLDLDVGAFYTTVPDTNVDVYGAEVRYAFLPGSTTTPAIAVRGSYVAVAGVDSFDLDSTAIDVSLSKGIGPITPYVGAGYVSGEATPGAAFAGLRPAKVEDAKAWIGVRLSLGLFEFTPEVGTVGDVVTYSARIGLSI
jgi:hypothetical protein